MSFELDILLSLDMLSIDINPTYLILDYHRSFEPYFKDLGYKLIFKNILMHHIQFMNIKVCDN
jgi:hypothetical protein